jgi:catechol 2,3-dioxygenase-like lactoylglutathione lyase family enzyme
MAHNCRLAMVILMVTDIEKAVAFYESLGAQKRCLFPKSWAELTLDGITIALCNTDQEVGQRRTGLVFAVDDLMAFYAQQKGVLTFLEEPVIKLHGIMTSLQDPSGNIIELYQATPEKVREFMEKQSENGCCKGDVADDECCRS